MNKVHLLKMLEAAVNTSMDGFWITDFQGNILQTNEAYAEISGYSMTELLNLSIGQLDTTHDSDQLKTHIEKVITLGHDTFETRHRHKNGYEIDIEVSAIFLPEYQQFCGFFRDITELTRAAKKLRNSEAQFRAFYDSTSEAVMLINENGFFDCNQATLTLFGCPTYEQFFTYHPADLSPPQQPCGTDSMILANQHIATAIEKGSLRFEWLHWHIDTNTPFLAEVLLNAIMLDDKQIIHATVHDITARKQVESELCVAKQNAETTLNQLKIAQKSLVEVEKMAALGGLVAGVAHEINTPVGIMLTSATHFQMKTNHVAELYEQGELDEAGLTAYFKLAQKSSQLITTNSQRAADLIRSFKQVAVDQTSGNRRKFEFKHYIEEVLLSLQPALKNTAIHIELDCPEGLIVNSYAGAISQIMTNFIMNSVQHAYEPNQNGILSIRVTRLDNDMIQLVYTDNGKGIPKENQSKVFDPFFTTQRANGGSGLGLHVVHNLVYQTLKGDLKLHSTANETTFTIQFPCVTPPPSNKN